MSSSSRAPGRIAILPDIAGLYGFIVFCLLVIFDSGKALIDGDTLWHIAAGKRMLANGTILTRDVFSHTADGKPWTAHEWLSEIVMAWIHQHAGLIGTALFFFAIAALSFWLLFRIVSSLTGDWTAIIAVSVAFYFSMSHLLVRPHVFSWLFGVLTLFALYKGGRWFWILPPLTALWANLHGGFILGLALQGLWIGGAALERFFSAERPSPSNLLGELKIPVFFLAASLVAAGLNPFGYKLFLFPFQVTSGLFSTGISEWLPPDLQSMWDFRVYLLSVILLMSLSRTRINWTDRLFALFFLNAAMTHQRYIGIATVFLCPWLARTIRTFLPRRRNAVAPQDGAEQLPTSVVSGPAATIVLATVLALLATPAFPRSRAIMETFLPLPADVHPIKAVQYLNDHRPTGKMFNRYGWGGYLIYAMDPPQKVFIDGRADMYGEEIFGDYEKIAALHKDTESLLERYGIDWVLFPGNSVLVRYLKATGKWREIYSDETASVLVRLAGNSP